MGDGIDDARVRHIAALARLELDEADIARSREEMSRILAYFDQLSSVDTTGVDPLAHPLPLRNVWAEDVAGESLDGEAALRNAPHRDDGFFAVPKVLDDGDGA